MRKWIKIRKDLYSSTDGFDVIYSEHDSGWYWEGPDGSVSEDIYETSTQAQSAAAHQAWINDNY